MFDLDLLHAFVSVVDSGGFTRAGERVHRTQSTVSQQIRRLEEQAGQPLLERGGRTLRLTEDGERLLSYARRILALSQEAKAALVTPDAPMVRLGIPDDFALVALTGLVADFARDHEGMRLSVRCALSREIDAAFRQGDLDVALLKREPGAGPATAAWPERPSWIAAASLPLPLPEPVPLIAFPQNCLYRNRAIHALERAGRTWRIVYESPSLIGLQAALAGGLGVAVLERRALGPGLTLLDEVAGLPSIAPTELALSVAPRACRAARDLARSITDFCDREMPRGMQGDRGNPAIAL